MSGADTNARSERRGGEPTRPAEPTPLHLQNRELVPPPATPPPLLVLIVEDEEPIADAIAIVVAEAGYTALVATHGKQAVEYMHTQRPALVITDLMMPQMDGLELIHWLHADAHTHGYPPPPIILMTAAGMRKAQDAGADMVLRKPFDLDELDALLHYFLDTGRSS